MTSKTLLSVTLALVVSIVAVPAQAAEDLLSEAWRDLQQELGGLRATEAGTPLPDNGDLAASLGADPMGESSNPPSIQPPLPAVLLSDSFDRPVVRQGDQVLADLKFGGEGRHTYVPIFAGGAQISEGTLRNRGQDYGGMQLANADDNPPLRGENLGQDFNLRVDLFVPGQQALTSMAGPYFRSRKAAANDGIIGGTSAGYWIQLLSTGEVRIKRLNPHAVIATLRPLPGFDNTAFHRMDIAASGQVLQVALDGKLLAFEQDGKLTTKVAIPATEGENGGTLGIAFSAEDNRGQMGGQQADNLIISRYSPLDNLPVQ